MPRPPRVDAPGAIHHVMLRGVERREIFRNDEDRGLFVDRFERLVVDLGFGCDALTLIANHVHAVIQTGDRPLAVLMQRLGFFYAQRFNRTNARTGHLFESRYKAKLVSDEGGLVRVVAYVVGNAVRHRLATLAELPEDPWNLMSALAGRRKPRRYESASRLRDLLGGVRWIDAVREHALAADALDAALEPDLAAELDGLIREMCLRYGVPRASLCDRAHRDVRAHLLRHAVATLRIPVVRAAAAVGVSRSVAHGALARR